jgi:hypothetical protein
MGKEEKKDLLRFLKPFPKEVQERALWLRDFIWDRYPGCNELIYDNYNALAFGWSPTEKVGHTFCSVAVGRTSMNVHLGFYWGSEIADPQKMLKGEGNQYRYFLFESLENFPRSYMEKLIREAHVNSLSKVKDKKQIIHGKTIMKSISDKKRTKAAAGTKSASTPAKNPAKKSPRGSKK